ncbi:hypothetical protein BS78_K166300 [Paspalum vaginatum]|uniref:DUF4220 domain-containing protein n=1 Tax=Paspalum vaginatum TaxID=158149 RepID=A0A9W8CFF1_9POAL|nr:hypothetical protein BS78_K166300 [Paspalum vaginatum]KAJ1255747.1 hypothetical protein BS78_K166300 [Paspalum vaginatum]
MIAAAGASGGLLMEKQSLLDAARALWNNVWEIRSMILVSLFLQVFLFLLGGMRRRSSSRFLSTLLWLAYLSVDSVAFYVLGHLAVRASEPGHQLVSFWAPFQLVHLGGQESITAFSKQDNELWLRHLLNLVTQVAVAGYVMAMTSWSDAWLRAAMVLMFLCGCFKYAERTLMLCSSDPVAVLSWWAKRYWSMKLNKPPQHDETDNDDDPAAALGRIRNMMSQGRSSSSGSYWRSRGNLYWDANALIPDLITVYAPINMVNKNVPGKLEELLMSSEEARRNAYEFVGAVLGHAFRQLYTKDLIRKFLHIVAAERLRRVTDIVALLYTSSSDSPTLFSVLSPMAAD